jgi:hypothetical protein
MPVHFRSPHSVVVCLAAKFTSAILSFIFFVAISGCDLAIPPAWAQKAPTSAPPAANDDRTYQALRNLTLGSEAVSVTNFELKRDAGTFHLRSGTLCFVAPVNGRSLVRFLSGMEILFSIRRPRENARV